jgi:hypothetical protein
VDAALLSVNEKEEQIVFSRVMPVFNRGGIGLHCLKTSRADSEPLDGALFQMCLFARSPQFFLKGIGFVLEAVFRDSRNCS